MLWSGKRISDVERPQRKLKAELLQAASAQLAVDALNPGHGDLTFGLGFLRTGATEHELPYVSANLADPDGQLVFPATRVIERGGLTIGVTGVLPERSVDGGSVLPVDAAVRGALADLQKQDVDLVVLLSNLGLDQDKKLAETTPGFDLIFGSGSRRHQEQPALVGETAVFQAGSRGKHLGEVTLELIAGAKGWSSPGAREAALRQATSIDRQIERYEGLMETATEAQKPRYDKALQFARKRRADLVIPAEDDGQANKLEGKQIAMSRSLDDEPKMVELVNATLEKLGDVAPEAATATKKQDRGDWVGTSACRSCHPVQFADWRQTSHAHAWATLVKDKRHMDLQCWSCHVTGANQPGGPTTPKESAGLQNVQCEACHGPGKKHVENPAKVKPVKVPGPEVCLTCHNEEQSEGRFDYSEYLPRVDHKP
jgi:hypothetical protein